MEKSGKVGQRNGICKGTVWFVMDGRGIWEGVGGGWSNCKGVENLIFTSDS